VATDINLNWLMTRLKHALQALAAPAEVQLGLFPDFVCKADELALDFGHWHECVVGNGADSLTQQQLSWLNALDERLGAMSGMHHSASWTDEALRTGPEWVEIRALAAESLLSLGWDLVAPRSYDYEFVPGGDDVVQEE
jgi:hypothetical protein